MKAKKMTKVLIAAGLALFLCAGAVFTYPGGTAFATEPQPEQQVRSV